VAEPALPLKLIVGLGNPGSEYAHTRHNAGWWLVDALADKYGGRWRSERRWQLLMSEVHLVSDAGSQGSTVWLIKPTAYMNRSGTPVAAFTAFYRLAPAQMLIAHDDIDLPPGVARVKYDGGHGGHNGLRDVIAQLGPEFWRLRLGVGHPGVKDLVIGAVLDRPTTAEQTAIEDAMGRALQILPELVAGSRQRAIHRLHSGNPRPAPPSSAPA
jgi:peptidyl-tRNA hydrolase, PTH1 family